MIPYTSYEQFNCNLIVKFLRNGEIENARRYWLCFSLM